MKKITTRIVRILPALDNTDNTISPACLGPSTITINIPIIAKNTIVSPHLSSYNILYTRSNECQLKF